MKQPYLLPVAILLIILALSLWNSWAVSSETAYLQDQLYTINELAEQAAWNEATSRLKESYQDWTQIQTWLHIVTEHDILIAADAMYHRAIAFAFTQESSEFRAELAELQTQLRVLAETERFRLENIL